MKIAVAIAGALFCFAASVQAQAVVSLSRATVELGPGTWVELGRTKRVVASVEHRGDLVAEVVTSGLVDGHRLRAVVTVMSTPTGTGRRINWTDGCPASSESTWSAPLKGGHPEDRECAEVTAAHDGASSLDAAGLRELVHKRALTPPSEMVSVFADVLTRFGRMMSVQVLADSAFVGLPDGAAGPVPPQVKAAHAAYAVELGRRVRGSLFSISGRMEIPALSFAAEAPGGARVALQASAATRPPAYSSAASTMPRSGPLNQ